MKPIYIKQYWKGVFSYLDGYETINQYKEVSFSMEITINDNSFIGTSTDSESKDVFDKPAIVKGFIDDDKMSFIVKYPCAYFKDEDGKIVIDKSLEHPDIHYLGIFDDNKKNVDGNWEMTIYEEKYGDDYLSEILNGEFQMKRMN
tara:strand:- start:1004 stop:1438 length:435 start_codon:yes stop_codon:yes gene_type:complete